MARSEKLEALLAECVKDLESDLKPHDQRCKDFDRRYRSYRGVLEKGSKADSWKNKEHPQLVLRSIEVMIAALIDPSPKWRIKANPIVDDLKRIDEVRAGARANELLIQYQLSCDHYAEKQRPFDMQGLICGITASKQYWQLREGPGRHNEHYTEPIFDDFGVTIGEIPKVRQTSVDVIFQDNPTTEVIDVRDLILEEGALDLQRSSRLHHRIWLTFEELERLEKKGIIGPQAGGESVQRLKESREFSSMTYNREEDLFSESKVKGKIEVFESWREYGQRVVLIANRGVVLSDRRNPFWLEYLDHQFPFVVCSGMPDLFRMPGISEVELIAEMQEQLWSLTNQRLDATEIIANPIRMIADDIEDEEAFEWAPGEDWLVPRPVKDTIQMFSPDVEIVTATFSAEQALRGDIQDVSGAMSSGDDSQSVNQATATGVSILTSLAQKRLAQKKQQFLWGKRRIGEQWCALNQQFITSERAIEVIGAQGARDWEVIKPELLKGNYTFEVEMAEDSLIRSEKRAEAISLMQAVLPQVGIAAEMGVFVNPKAYFDNILDSYDVTDKERFYMDKPPAAMKPPAAPQTPAEPNGSGVTNTALAAGLSSPSNDTSMSPEAAMQRFGASRGGPMNA